MIEHLQTLTIWLDSTGANYSLKLEMSNKALPLVTVAVYRDYWKSFSANTNHAALVDMARDIKQFLKL